MVVGDCIQGAEVRQVVLVGRIVAVPGHHIEGREGLAGLEQPAVELVQDLVGGLAVLESGYGSLEVPGIGEAIRTCPRAAKSGGCSDLFDAEVCQKRHWSRGKKQQGCRPIDSAMRKYRPCPSGSYSGLTGPQFY